MFLSLNRRIASLVLIAVITVIGSSCSAQASTIEPGQTGSLVPEIFNDGSGATRFGLSLEIDNPDGSIEISDFASDGTVLATTTITFIGGFGSSVYQYGYDATYYSVNGLIDIESLFPGLDLVGELGGYPAAAEPWVSEHTELNSGKIIWSFEDSGTVITLDPSAGEAEVHTPTFDGFASNIPTPLLELPATIAITNLTPETIKAANLIPEPASVALMLLGGAFVIGIARR